MIETDRLYHITWRILMIGNLNNILLSILMIIISSLISFRKATTGTHEIGNFWPQTRLISKLTLATKVIEATTQLQVVTHRERNVQEIVEKLNKLRWPIVEVTGAECVYVSSDTSMIIFFLGEWDERCIIYFMLGNTSLEAIFTEKTQKPSGFPTLLNTIFPTSLESSCCYFILVLLKLLSYLEVRWRWTA